MLKKLIPISSSLIILISLLFPLTSAAQEEDKLTKMFNDFGFYVNNTQPGVYKSQTRGFISGGSLSARAKYDTVTWGSITPPKMQAGCGGIDMYFGGVSFLSKDEYINMAKSIGQNALGYAFQLGLEATCPTCNAVLKYLQEQAGKFNKYTTDSCEAAKKLVNGSGLFDFGQAEQTVESCARNLIEMNITADEAEARSRCLTSNPDLAQATYDQARSKNVNNEGSDKPLPGIALLNAMNRVFTTAEKTLLLNVFGTYVYQGPGDNGKESRYRFVERTISFKDLMYGKPDAKVYYPKALNDDYSSLSNEEIEDVGETIDYTTIGDNNVKEYLNRYLQAGGFVKKIEDQMVIILNKTKTVPATALTPTEEEFLNAMPAPVITILQSTKNVEGLPESAISMISNVVAINMIRTLIDGYVKELLRNAHKQHQIAEHKYREEILQVNNEMHQLLMEELQNFDSSWKTYQLAEFYRDQLSNKVSESIMKGITAAGGGGK